MDPETLRALLANALAQSGDPTKVLRTPYRAPVMDGQPSFEMSNAAPPKPNERPSPWEVRNGIAEALSPTMMGYGIGQAAGTAVRDYEAGNYGSALGHGALAALGIAPGVKPGLRAIDQALAAGVRAMPEGVGSMGGKLPAPKLEIPRDLDSLGYIGSFERSGSPAVTEHPVVAAVRIGDRVFEAPDHHGAAMRARDVLSREGDERALDILASNEFDRGFVTDRKRYVDRQEALDLAATAGGPKSLAAQFKQLPEHTQYGYGLDSNLLEDLLRHVQERKFLESKGSRPEPGARGPEAEATGASHVLAETPQYKRAEAAAVKAYNEYEWRDGSRPNPVASSNDINWREPGPAAAALEAIARSYGHDLSMLPGGYGGSHYGKLRLTVPTPDGPAAVDVKIRVADHGRQSGQHDAAHLNITPDHTWTIPELAEFFSTIRAKPVELENSLGKYWDANAEASVGGRRIAIDENGDVSWSALPGRSGDRPAASTSAPDRLNQTASQPADVDTRELLARALSKR